MIPNDDEARGREPGSVPAPPASPKGRQVVAAGLTLLMPGAGHFLLGHFARGVLWVGIQAAFVLSIPLTTIVGVYGNLLTRFVAGVDALRLNDRRPMWKRLIASWAALVVLSGLFFSLARTYLTRAYVMPTGSMEPTLLVGDYLMTNNIAYRFRSPQRGDIVVFKYPRDEAKDFLKRCIALGGEKVEIRDKILYIDGLPVPEPYVVHADARVMPRTMTSRDNFGPIIVPPGQLFVLGDNRDNSLDSRVFGLVPQNLVIGKAAFIYWSWDRWHRRTRFDRLGRSLEPKPVLE